MKERFEGENEPALLAALARQFNSSDSQIAQMIAAQGELLEFGPGTSLIKQDASDNDVHFIVAGHVDIIASGSLIRTLGPGDHVGEMSAIAPSLPRAANVIAKDTVVSIKLSAGRFLDLANKYPATIWQSVSQSLAMRLHDRNRLLPKVNEKPKVFIISSVEGLPIANTVQSMLQHDVLATVWAYGVFWAGSFTLEQLEKAVDTHDFGIAIALFEDMTSSPSRNEDAKPALRDNVLFELGMFTGRLGRARSLLLHPAQKGVRLPSDLQGLNTAKFVPGSSDDDLEARLGPAVTDIRKVIKREGVRV